MIYLDTSVALANYDGRMTAVARAMEIPLFQLTRHGGDAMPGPEVTAVEMARGEGVDPKRFRRALRGEIFPWHSPNALWTVGRDSPEHRDRFLKSDRGSGQEPELDLVVGVLFR